MKVVAQVFQWVVTLASKSNLRIGGAFAWASLKHLQGF